MTQTGFAFAIGNFVFVVIAFARLWALRDVGDSTAFSQTLHVMSVPAVGFLCITFPIAVPDLARWRVPLEVMSAGLFVIAAVLLISRLGF
jgi:hypothetical protein